MSKKYIAYFFTILTLFIFNSCGIYRSVVGEPPAKQKEIVVHNDSINIFSEDLTVIDAPTEFIDTIQVIDTIKEELIVETVDDTLNFIQQMLNDTAVLAKVFKNKYGRNDKIYPDTRMLKGSALINQLENLTNEHFYNKYTFVTDRNKLNKYGYEENEKPIFSDSIYALRVERLNLQTPIKLVYNEHVKAFINVYAKKGRNQTSRMLGLKEIYFPIFEELLDKYNMPLELKYLAVVESALNPTAGSRAGAKGLWQFMYGTGKRYGLKVNSLVDDRFDPYKATEAAVRHLNDLHKIYKNWELALAAYNSGPGNVNRAIRRAGGVKDYWAIWPFLPRETRGYVPAFIAVNYVFNYNIEHNIYPVNPGILANGIDSVTVREPLAFDQISEFMNIDIEDLKFLNPAYKHGIIPATYTETYILRLPRAKVGYYLDHEYDLYNFKSKNGIEKEKLLVQIKKAKERTIHIVKSGENLGFIARRYRTSVRRIKSWNGMRNSRIYPGQKLVVFMGHDSGFKQKNKSKKKKKAKTFSDRKYKYHVIQSGDTLWDLARKYDTNVAKIKKWNGIKNSYRLKLGDKLIIGKKG